MWMTVAILELKRQQMPQLSIQRSSVDNRGNPRAKTYATVIPRNLCAGEMPTQLAMDDGNLGLIPEREHKKLPHANEGRQAWKSSTHGMRR